MKDISLVMPVYNPQLDILRGMLESIFLASGGADFELVAVNDGSTNGADAILREWDAAHPGRMKILDRENRGAGPSRNEGFLATEGRYIWFVDSDDVLRPGCLPRIVAAMDETGADDLLLGFDVADPGSADPFPEGDGGVCEASKTFAILNFYRAPWKHALRRAFLERIGVSFCNARTGMEDRPETARWILEADRLFRLDLVCYRYIFLPSSLSNRLHTADSLETGVRICDLFRGLAERFPGYRDWMLFSEQVTAADHMKLCSGALTLLSSEKDPPPELRARLESLRETYRRIAYAPTEDHALFNLYDRGRRTAFDEKRPEIESLKTSVRQLRTRAEAAETSAAAKARRCGELEAALRKSTARAETAEAQGRKLDSSVQKLRTKVESLRSRLAAMQSSLSWRVTAPLRAAVSVFTGKRRVSRDGR